MTKKLKRSEPVSVQKKTKKMALLDLVCSQRQVIYEYCLENGGGEVVYCWTDVRLVEECIWIETSNPFLPSDLETPPFDGDPFDCDVNDSWPWCQDGGNDGDEGSGGEGPMPNSIVTLAPDYPIQDIIDYLKCFNKNQGAKLQFTQISH